MPSSIKLDDIRKELEPQGWKIISDSYTNLTTTMQFECPEGHQVYSTWRKLRQQLVCPTCANNVGSVDVTAPIKKPQGAYRILALDQATHNTGFAIFDNKDLVAMNVFAATGEKEIERIASVKQWLLSMIENWKPDLVGLEGIQLQGRDGQQSVGVTVFETLAHLQGVLMLACHEAHVPFIVCNTNTWRASIGVKGKARTDRKRSMQLLVKQWYDITVIDDIADAIGIGRYLSQSTRTANVVVESWET